MAIQDFKASSKQVRQTALGQVKWQQPHMLMPKSIHSA